MSNTNKVNRYYRNFLEASEALYDYIEEVGSCLEECEYISDSREFRDRLDKLIEDRNSATVQLERVVREEKIGVGPITVTERTVIHYDGKTLYRQLSDKPEIRDKIIEIEYKVKTPEFRKAVSDGTLTSEQKDSAILDIKKSTTLKGVPKVKRL